MSDTAYEPETDTCVSISAATAELVVETFDDGTARIEIAEYAAEVAPRRALDVLAYLTADELRELADALNDAADLLDAAYAPEEDGADEECAACTEGGIACDEHAVR